MQYVELSSHVSEVIGNILSGLEIFSEITFFVLPSSKKKQYLLHSSFISNSLTFWKKITIFLVSIYMAFLNQWLITGNYLNEKQALSLKLNSW